MAARIPRDKLTRILRDIAGEISSGQSYVANCSWFGTKYQVPFKVVGLWAFGSWARGGTDCGDLDLLVTVEFQGDMAPTDEGVAVAVRRRRRHLDILLGPPDRPGFVAKDAVLIWSDDAPDWERAIDSIAVDPAAGHHPRPWDVLGVKLARLRVHQHVLDSLMTRVEDKTIEVQWAPLDSLRPLTADESALATRWDFGKASARVLSIALDAIDALGGDREQITHLRPSQVLAGVGFRVGVGGWSRLRLDALDRLGCNALVVVPAWSSSGPNGALYVRRGHQHSLVRAFRDVVGFTTGHGLVDASGVTGQRASVLELYDSYDAAAAVGWGEPVERHGLDILRLLDKAEAVEVCDEAFALGWKGQRYLVDVGWGDPDMNPDAIATRIADLLPRR